MRNHLSDSTNLTLTVVWYKPSTVQFKSHSRHSEFESAAMSQKLWQPDRRTPMLLSVVTCHPTQVL